MPLSGYRIVPFVFHPPTALFVGGVDDLLDKGLAVIEASFPKGLGGIDASAARAYAQECARRAAIRNPQYREKRDNTLSVPDGGPVGIKFDAITFTVVDPKRDATGD